MSTPTFDSKSLTSRGEKQIVGPPQTRTFMATLVGVEGLYTQQNPVGGRRITVRGLLSTAGSTPQNALSLLQGDIEALQDKQGLAKNYKGTDGTTYPNTVLQSYSSGEIEVGLTSGASTYTAVAAITAVLVHTVPSVTS